MAGRPIDEKIVVMRLDNSDFAQKASETTSLFGKLRDALNKVPGVNLQKTATELGNIQTEASKTNLNRLSESVQMIAGRFTNLGIVGVTALQNITNRAVDAGIALAKNLSVDQITAGFQEYELKMGSIQTILANTQKHGTNLDDVSDALNKLNDYADQTIYNFGDMTKNIGLFTNAGLKLEESVSMIKGFSNAAAASGTDAQGAAHAAYQLSQALSAGTIRLMDWRSLTNVGMGNKNMQEGLVALATAMGGFSGTSLDAEMVLDDFNGSLEKNWLSADIMSKYLQIMAKDMGATEMAALGLTDSQIKLFEQQATTAEEAATKVRTFSGLMDGLKEAIGSGWAVTFEQIFGDFDEATVLWTRLSDAVNGFFTASGNKRNDFLKGIADKGGFLNIFDGVANALKPVMQMFDALSDGFSKAFPPKSVNQVVVLTKSFKEFTKGLTLSESTVAKLTTVFQGAFAIFSSVIEIAKLVGQALLNLIPEGAGGSLLDLLVKVAELSIGFNTSLKNGNALTSSIEGFGNVLSIVGDILGTVIKSVGSFSSSLGENLGRALDWIIDKLTPFGQLLKEAFGSVGGDDVLGAGALVGIFMIAKKIKDTLGGGGDGLSGILENLGDAIENAGGMFESLGESLQAFATGIKIANLVLIAGSLVMIASALNTLEGIETEDLAKGLMALTVALGVMMAGLAVISKFNIVGGLKASATLLAIAASVNIMASALEKISDIDPERLKSGMSGLIVVTGSLVAAVIAISKLGGKIKTGSLTLLALAGSIYILAEAVEELAKIKTGDLKKSIVALGIIFAELALFMLAVNKVKLSPTSAVGLIAVAGSIQMMVNAIEDISDVDTVQLVTGLSTIAIILGQIAIFSKVAGGPQMLLAGAGMLIIAGAINALVPPIRSLGGMSWEELVKGLLGMSTALAAVAGAGLLASGAIGGAIAITVMAGALNMLIGPIERFAGMTWTELIKGIGGMALGLGALAGVSLLLTPAVGPMLAFGAAVALMGVAVTAVGAGLALFATGLATLATLTATSVAAIVAALGLLLKGFAELIPAAVKFVVDVGSALLTGLVELVPKLVTTITELVMAILRALEAHIKDFLVVGVSIVVKIIEGIAEALPGLVTAALDLIETLIRTLADAIGQNGPQLISAVLDLIGEILILIIDAGVQLVTALFGWIPGVTDAAKSVGEAATKYIRDNLGAEEVGDEKGKEFAKALEDTGSKAKTAGEALAKAGQDGAGSIKMEATGAEFGQGFVNGMGSESMLSKAITAAKSLASSAYSALRNWLEVRSPSRKTDKVGQETGQGFANGIAKKKKAAAAAAKKVAQTAKENFESSMDKAKYRLDMGEINDAQYIKSLEKIRNVVSKNAEHTRKVNLEIKKAQDRMAKDEEQKAKDAQAAVTNLFNKRKALIDEQLAYNKMSNTQELAAWERMQARYKEGTEERKQADREVYRLKNEINNKLIDINERYYDKMREVNQKLIDDEMALNQKYEDAVISRTNDLKSSLGSIFSEMTLKSDITGTKLLDNLRGQVNMFMDWSRDIQHLANQGIDEGLLKELRDMGPSAASEIKALTTLSNLELIEYSNIWKARSELARTQAMGELEGMKNDTADQIKQLRSDAAKQLEEYRKEWLSEIQKIRFGTEEEFVGLDDKMETIGEKAMKGLKDGLNSMKGSLINEATGIAKGIADAINRTLQTKVDSGIGVIKGTAVPDKSSITKATDAANKAIQGVNTNASEIKVTAVVENLVFDNLNNVKIPTASLIPDVSYTNQSLASVQQPIRGTVVSSQPAPNNSANNEVKGLTAAITSLLDKPQVTQLFVDGKKMTEVVSRNQYSNSQMSAVTKGVI